MLKCGMNSPEFSHLHQACSAPRVANWLQSFGISLRIGGYFDQVLLSGNRRFVRMTVPLSPAQISEIVEMALSDHISFTQISAQHKVTPDEIKIIMRTQLKPGSYRAWRKRVRDFGDRREHYK